MGWSLDTFLCESGSKVPEKTVLIDPCGIRSRARRYNSLLDEWREVTMYSLREEPSDEIIGVDVGVVGGDGGGDVTQETSEIELMRFNDMLFEEIFATNVLK